LFHNQFSKGTGKA